ncbi:MAG: hypothetical protein H7336_12765 [Bacteriovorax sp.]|nr:hypothetical protein [Bacteriovorax sp.]
MNNFLHENLFAIILFLLMIIFLLIGLIGVVIIKLLFNPKNSAATATPATQEETPLIIPTIETARKLRKLAEETVVEKFFCENHPDTSSAGACLICEDVFCEKCLIEHDSLYFCKEHFRVFANNKWKQITDVKTTPNKPDDGLFIYHFKRHIWRDNETPSFVLTHYKINIEEDFIESFIQLNVIEKDAERLSDEIEKYKARN